ncbi:MAG TPA: radical SAM protein [Gemmatimonadota bacterium]|nr:radical SAM protein [Gemmatimonadota bacterium]
MPLKVNEIFHSIQGESTHAGRPCVFVRLTYCNLRCSYCDTEYAFFEGKERPLDEILAEVARYRCRLVEVTGGEPLIQKETTILLERLLDEGYEVLLETSGAWPVETVPDGVKIIMDLKTPGSGMAAKNRWENLRHLDGDDEIKFVICDRPDYEWARGVVGEHDLTVRHAVLFSPSFGQLSAGDLAGWILEDRLPVRLQLQMHKLVWSPTARGV